jgi:pentatricopeptide repeat protein
MLTEYVRRFSKVKAYDMVEQVLSFAKSRNIRLRTPGFLVYASNLLQDGKPEEARKVLNRMSEYSCMENDSTRALRQEMEAK